MDRLDGSGNWAAAPDFRDMIAIVDDDEAVRDSLKLLLETYGLGVGTYGSAQEFLDDKSAWRSRFLVLDCHMPGMSGVELLQTLRAGDALIPAVVITARPDATIRRQALEAGAKAVCEKPVDDQTLLGLINALAPARSWPAKSSPCPILTRSSLPSSIS